jgi:hypothetical protein
MLKTISAALLAVSVLAAPALAATSGKADPAAVTKQAPVKATSKTAKSSVLNANAKMGAHHTRHYKHYRHLSQHKAGTPKTHTKVSAKQAKPVSKRG